MRKYLDIISGSNEQEATNHLVSAPKRNLLNRYVGLVEEGYSAATVAGLKLDEFIRGFIEAMLASNIGHETGEQLKKHYTSDDLSHDAMDQIDAECRTFLHKAGAFITPDRYTGPELTSLEAQAGHDFFMQRSHNGGFAANWENEHNYGEGGPLSRMAAAMGTIDPYVGPDGKIHLM